MGTFNNAALRLTAEDIDALEASVEANDLPFTEGFFFGESVPEYQDRDREFIAKAREALGRGKFLCYGLPGLRGRVFTGHPAF